MGGQKGKFVVIDEGFNLELEDLLRASAYVVGKSRSGIVYKVVAGGRGSGAVVPAVVTVRRLNEGDATWSFKEFESEVEAIGRVQHPNILRLRAYFYANDEKLLISDFIRNGSLYTALHGNIPLNFIYLFLSEFISFRRIEIRLIMPKGQGPGLSPLLPLAHNHFSLAHHTRN